MTGRSMNRGGRGLAAALLVTGVLALPGAVPARAQDGPSEWLARIFDPAAVGLEVFPGAQLNRKLSADAIQLERGGSKRIAIFIIPLAQVPAAAAHFATQLAVPPQVMAAGSPFETDVFDLTKSDAPPRLKGLRVQVSRSPFVDGKGQITMEYLPPAK